MTNNEYGIQQNVQHNKITYCNAQNHKKYIYILYITTTLYDIIYNNNVMLPPPRMLPVAVAAAGTRPRLKHEKTFIERP